MAMLDDSTRLAWVQKGWVRACDPLSARAGSERHAAPARPCSPRHAPIGPKLGAVGEALTKVVERRQHDVPQLGKGHLAVELEQQRRRVLARSG